MSTELSTRQIEIINVSLDLIAEKGIQGLTIKNLAKKIGFSESAIYRHFDNKVQILIGALEYFNQLSKEMMESNTDYETSSITKIENLFYNHFKMFANHPAVVAVLFSEEIFRNETVLLQKVKELVQEKSQHLVGIIERGQRKGEIRNDIIAVHLSVILLGALRMFVSQLHLATYSFNISDKGSDFIDSIKILISS